MVFEILFQMSIQASVLIAVVLVLRFFIRRLPKIYSCCLWLLVLLRLLCPVFIESNLSLQPVGTESLQFGQKELESTLPEIEKTDMQISQEEKDGYFNSNSAENDMVLPPLPGNPLEEMIVPVAESLPEETQLPELGSTGEIQVAAKSQEEQEPQKAEWEITRILCGAWLAGTIILLLCYLAQYGRMRWQLRMAVRMEQRENVWFGDVDSPFVMGVIRPRIYIPYGIEEKSLVHILHHEEMHIRHLDPQLRLLFMAAVCLHWWNPLVWIAVHFMNQDMEMFCDEAALKNATLEEKKEYSRTLLGFAMRRSGLGVMLGFGESNTKKRVEHVLKLKKPAFLLSAVLVFVIAGCIVCFLTVPKKEVPLQLPDVVFAELTPELAFWQDFEGYLDDASLSEMEFYSDFQKTDYDGDGVADRVYRERKGDNVNYRIEFGSGAVLEFPMAGKLNWISIMAVDLNGDGINEIVFEGNYFVSENSKTISLYAHPFAFYSLNGRKYKKMEVPVSSYAKAQGKEILGYDFYYELTENNGVRISCEVLDYSTKLSYASEEIREDTGYGKVQEGENICSGYSGEIRYCTYEGKPAVIYADYLTKSIRESRIFSANKIYTVLTFEGNQAVCRWIGEDYRDHVESELGATERQLVNGEIYGWNSKECQDGKMPELDMDFDGYAEKIDFVWSKTNYEIMVADQKVRGEGENVEDSLIALAFDYSGLYLAVVDYPDNAPRTTLYTYEKNHIYKVGTVPFDIREAEHSKDSQSVTGKMLVNMIFEDEVTVSATLGETGKSIETEKNYRYSPMNQYNVLLKEAVFVYNEKDTSSIGFYLEPQLISFEMTDGKNWIYVSGQYGNYGWLRVNHDGTLPDNDKVRAVEIMEKRTGTGQDAFGNHMQLNRYTGYLDDASLANNIYVKAPYDIDGDGLTDRIHKGQDTEGNAVYRIEFGNGDILETEGINSSYVCDWKAMELTGDKVLELVCSCYSQAFDPHHGLMDIMIYTKVGNRYERLDTPVSDGGKFGYEISYRRQNSTTIYAFCEETGFEYTFELKEQEQNGNYFKESGSFVYHLFDTVRCGKWNGKTAMVFQQILDGSDFDKSLYSVVTFENGEAKCQWMGTAKQYREIDGKQDMMADYNRFQAYTGYMDQFASGTIWHYVYMPEDVDGDGKKDRIYRSLSGNSAIYRVEFGDGMILTTSPVPKGTTCQWSVMELTGDEEKEIVCSFYDPFSAASVVKDIQIFEKDENSYRKLSLPIPSPTVYSFGNPPLTGYDISYELVDLNRIRIFYEECGFSQEFELPEGAVEYYHLSKEGVWSFELMDDMGRTLWQGKPAFYFRQLLGGRNCFAGIYVVVTFENGKATCEWMGTTLNASLMEPSGQNPGTVNGMTVVEVGVSHAFEDVALVMQDVNSNELSIDTDQAYELQNANIRWVKCYSSNLRLYDEPDILAENQSVRVEEVTFLATNLGEWFYVRCDDGNEGWLQITKDGKVPCVRTSGGAATVTQVFVNGFAGDKFE